MYLGMAGGLFGATGRVFPSLLESERMCGECGKRERAEGDWLCERCRAEVNAHYAANSRLIGRLLDGEEAEDEQA